MKLKLILGIIIPIFLIVIFTILGTWPSGFSMDKSFDSEMEFDEVFLTTNYNNAMRIGEITVSNEYFLPKRFDAPNYISCIYDKDNKRPLQDGGYVFYNEGSYSPNIEILDLTKGVSSDLAYYRPYNYNNRNYKTSVEIGAYETKTLQIYYTASNNYRYSNIDNSQREYDTLLLVNRETNNQINCQSLSSEQIQDSKRITITPASSYCSDTDDNNYNSVANNELSQFGVCSDNSNLSFSDSCQDSNNIIEYTCDDIIEKKCGSQIIDCTSKGFNRCENNRCVY